MPRKVANPEAAAARKAAAATEESEQQISYLDNFLQGACVGRDGGHREQGKLRLQKYGLNPRPRRVARAPQW